MTKWLVYLGTKPKKVLYQKRIYTENRLAAEADKMITGKWTLATSDY